MAIPRALSRLFENSGTTPMAYKGVLMGFVMRAAWAVSSVMLTFVAARFMDATEFGYFAIGLSIALLIQAVFAFGQDVAILRFVPQFLGQKRSLAAYEFYLWSRALLLRLGAVGTVAVFAVYAVWSAFSGSVSLAILAGIGLGIVFAAATVAAMHKRVEGRIFAALFPKDVAWRLGLMAFIPIATAWGFGNAEIALGAAIFLILPIIIWQSWDTGKSWSTLAKDGEAASFDERNVWMSASLTMWVGVTFSALSSHADVLVVGIILSETEAGIYFAALRVAMLTSFFLAAINTVFAPTISRLFHSAQIVPLQRMVTRTSIVSSVPAALMLLLFIVAGDRILAVMGDGFSKAYWALVVLSAGQFVSAASGPTQYLLNMTEHHRIALRLNVVSALLQISLSLVLGTMYGIVGVACANAGVILAKNVAAVALIYKYTSVKTSILGLWRWWSG